MAKVKVSAGMVFERYEKKYRLTEETYQQLMERLGDYISLCTKCNSKLCAKLANAPSTWYDVREFDA